MKVGEQIQVYVRTFPGGEWLFEFEPLQAKIENIQPLICTITEEPNEESEAEFSSGSKIYVLKDERLGFYWGFSAQLSLSHGAIRTYFTNRPGIIPNSGRTLLRATGL